MCHNSRQQQNNNFIFFLQISSAPGIWQVAHIKRAEGGAAFEFVATNGKHWEKDASGEIREEGFWRAGGRVGGRA